MSRHLPMLAFLLGVPSAALVSQARTPPVQLVVHFSVDQMRPDYLSRWQSEFTGGLARLMRGGVVYLAAEQAHAVTETAPGHASMMSGRWPYSTGIIANDFGVPDAASPLIGTNGSGASPRRFQGTTLYDWMRAKDSTVRALSISRKDRGAILPVGRASQSVFWYSDGIFTTSRWYGTKLPDWLVAWNAQRPIEQLRGSEWVLLPGVTYPEVDNRPYEVGGRNNTFPHRLSAEAKDAAGEVTSFPVMDSLTLDVAWHGVRAMRLGQEGHPDFLAVSLSTTDAIGHRYGPGSLEMHDQIRRLDLLLGRFLDSIATVVPLDRVVISLTADHGGTDYPEAGTGGRLPLSAEVRELRQWAMSRWSLNAEISEESGLFLADTTALANRGVSIDSLSRALAAKFRGRPGVRDVLTPATLRTRRDAEAVLWRRQIMPGVGWLVAVASEPGWVYGSSTTSTSHGSSNILDRRVPVIVMAPGVAPRRVVRTIGVVDLAPTVARLLGVRPTEPLDGRVLPEVVSPRR